MRAGSLQDFREHLNQFSARIDNKARASTCPTSKEPLSDGCNETYWRQNDGTTPKWSNSRTIAYLAAYVDWAGPSFSGSGIRVRDGFVLADRAVMRSLLAGGFVRLDNCNFHLTDLGRALIAPFVVVSEVES